MINPPKATQAPTISRKAVMDWQNGVVTDYDAQRIVDNALTSAANVVIEQNGVVRPRPSLRQYGPQPIGRVLGEIREIKKMENAQPVFYLVSMQVIGEVAHICYTKGEDPAWVEIEDKDYDPEAECHFLQVCDSIIVLNGVDRLSYVDLSDWSITSFDAIDDPASAPRLKENHGLTGDGYKLYYSITASSTVGETVASEALRVQVNKPRDMWGANDEWIQIEWDPIDGAQSYSVYLSSVPDGSGANGAALIAAGISPDTTTFTDNGSRAQDFMSSPPVANSTAGPKCKRGSVINGRVWLVGDADDPYAVRYGGDTGYELDFSSTNGGGRVLIANGTQEVPIVVRPFRKGTGDNTVVVLTQGSNGNGKRYHLVPSTFSYGGEEFVSWDPTEDGGSDGTDSPDAVVFHNNSLYYPSRSGFRTTGTMPQLQNVLSTTDISATIRNQVQLLNNGALSKAVGLAYEGRIYWSVPVGADHNNRVWVFDLEHKGAWMLSWYLDVDWMTLYNDNSGETHFLLLIDNKIYELTRITKTQDDNEAFPTEIKSGNIKFHRDGREWARLIQVVFTFLKPQGDFSVQVTAHTEDGDQIFTQTASISSSTTCFGWGEATKNWTSCREWGEPSYDATDVSDVQDFIDVIVEVDEDVQWFSYRIASTESGTDYTVSSVVAEYVGIGIKDLS